MMNNETVKKLDITIKLRGDKVYDLYMDGKWVASRGGYDHTLEIIYDEVKRVFD